MVPGEILHHAFSRGRPHLDHDFGVAIQMFERRRNPVDIPRLHDDSFDPVTDNVARFACSNGRQTAGSRFIDRFCAALPLRWKNVNASLVKIILRVAHKADCADVFASELL
jgi:hypothetical protein